MIQLRAFPYQIEALQAQEKEVLILAGIATGKSHCGAYWILNKLSSKRKLKLAICANTYTQLITASVQKLIELLDDLGIKYKKSLSGAKKRIEVGNHIIYLFSLEKYDNIRGVEFDALWVDEIAYSCIEALQVLRGRMRGNFAYNRQILMTSSPNGFNFLYKEFGNITKDESIRMKKKLIKARTEENLSLDKDFFPSRLESYGGIDSPLARQELFGEFVNLQSGAIYNLFNRDINTKQGFKLDPNYPVYVGVDFNVDKMSAIYVQYINGKFRAIKEVQLTHRDANTFDLAQKILSDLKGFDIKIIADSTGKSRKTNSITSDHQILINAGLNVLPSRNSLIRDRQNNLNLHFKRELLDIDDSNKQVIEEIESLASRDTEGSVAHISVCLGYVVNKLNPLLVSVKYEPKEIDF